MAIQFRCPNCGSKISVEEIHAGEMMNCQACWDPVRVPSSPSLHAYRSKAHADDKFARDPLAQPLPRMIVQALKLGLQEHSRYFFAGIFLLFLVVFLSCGGVGVL